MHTSVFKLVWASLACIQVKFLYLHHKERVLIILAQGFCLHFGFIWFHKGFGIVSPILLSYLNSKVKCMICKFIMLWYASLYASLSCCDMQVYMQVCQVMLCKFGLNILFMLSCYASLFWVYEHKALSFMPKVAF